MTSLLVGVVGPGGGPETVLLVDGELSLRLLLPALVDELGLGYPARWAWWDGGRALDVGSEVTLTDLGITHGTLLRCAAAEVPTGRRLGGGGR